MQNVYTLDELGENLVIQSDMGHVTYLPIYPIMQDEWRNHPPPGWGLKDYVRRLQAGEKAIVVVDGSEVNLNAT